MRVVCSSVLTLDKLLNWKLILLLKGAVPPREFLELFGLKTPYVDLLRSLHCYFQTNSHAVPGWLIRNPCTPVAASMPGKIARWIFISLDLVWSCDLTNPAALQGKPWGSNFWFSVKCLKNYWMGFHEIWFPRSCLHRINCNHSADLPSFIYRHQLFKMSFFQNLV